MAALSLRLPESLHQAAREVAEQDGVSLNQLVTTALAEKIATLKTVDYLQQRAQGAVEGAVEGDWDRVLSLVPDAEPEIQDRFPTQK